MRSARPLRRRKKPQERWKRKRRRHPEGKGTVRLDLLGVGEKLNGAVDRAKKALGRFVDAVAVLIIINCVIPVLVLWFFLWLIKTAFSVDIHVPADRFLPGR